MPKRVAGVKATPPVELEQPGAMPRLSKFQAYTVRRIARRDLKNAIYNPRVISKVAREKLKGILSKGLVSALTWNKRTGNLVGGHQRAEILDLLERTQDYALDVCEIDVSPKREAELNFALNNEAAQGQFDADKLLAMLKAEPDFDFDAAGLDSMDVATLFGPDAPIANNLFAEENIPKSVKTDLDELAGISEEKREPAKKPAETPDERVERMRREKKEYREEATERDDTEYIAVVVFRDRAEKERFLVHIGIDPNERYPDGRAVMRALGIAPGAPVVAKKKKGKKK